MKCDDCGKELQIGDWPFCNGDSANHEPAKRFNYDAIKPYFDEDITERGEWITTIGQRRAIMAKNHLEYRKPASFYQGKRSYSI